MPAIKKLYRPSTVQEAIDLLSDIPQARPIAGGSDLLIKIRQKSMKGLLLVSLQNVKELENIWEDETGDIHLGPMCTFTNLAENSIIRKRLPMLSQAAESMGGPQTRNVATIGGNVCNGATSADSAPALFSLETQLVLRCATQSRTLPIAEFYKGPSQVDLRPGELLVDIIIPSVPAARFGGCYTKFSTRKAMDISIMGCSAICWLEESGNIQQVRIAMGTAAPTPVRCTLAEEKLKGEKLTSTLLKAASQQALQSIKPRTSWRASAEYRTHLAQALVEQTVAQAFAMAGGIMND